MKKILLLLIMIGLVSCKDRQPDPNVLPEATQTGANTGGALVDGKVWVAKIEQPNLTPGGNNTHYEFNNIFQLQIVLRSVDNPNNRIVINVTQNSEIGTQTYSDISSRFENLPKIYDINFGNNNSGSITITKLDITNKIVSGLFKFTASNIDGTGEKITITEGRFDKKFL